MQIFITGAAGFIGGSVAAHLIAAAQLAVRGVVPVQGTLDDAALLTREAAQADGVINAASSDHRAAVAALLAGLRGSGKPLLHTSGSSVIGDDAGGNALSPRIFDEQTPFVVEPGKQARHAIDQMVLAAAEQGVRSAVLCNSMIYGVGAGLHADSVQIPPLVAQARQSGVVRIVGAGVNRWSNVHIADVVDLYARVLDSAPAGAFISSRTARLRTRRSAPPLPGGSASGPCSPGRSKRPRPSGARASRAIPSAPTAACVPGARARNLAGSPGTRR